MFTLQGVFLIHRPSTSAIDHFLIEQNGRPFSYPEIGSTAGTLPRGYNVDRNSVKLGDGFETFQRAVKSLRDWQMFNLGWVELFPHAARIEEGTTVAVLIRHFGFWSLNPCRIVYVFEEERRAGFAYGTLPDHAEQGEERFSIEWTAEDDSVHYDILAFSKPRQPAARIAHPLARKLQRRFAHDSMAAMVRASAAGYFPG